MNVFIVQSVLFFLYLFFLGRGLREQAAIVAIRPNEEGEGMVARLDDGSGVCVEALLPPSVSEKLLLHGHENGSFLDVHGMMTIHWTTPHTLPSIRDISSSVGLDEIRHLLQHLPPQARFGPSSPLVSLRVFLHATFPLTGQRDQGGVGVFVPQDGTSLSERVDVTPERANQVALDLMVGKINLPLTFWLH